MRLFDDLRIINHFVMHNKKTQLEIFATYNEVYGNKLEMKMKELNISYDL